MTKDFKPRVLLVEDDPNLGNLLQEYLQAKEYDTTLATNGKEGLTQFKNTVFDVCILDVMMPVMDGFTLAREIRKLDAETPVIFLTAKSMKEDTIEGFNAGGDDYLTKPFSMEELLLRLKAILRRTKNQTLTNSDQNQFEVGTYKFDFNLQKLEVAGKVQKLTTREAELLKLLCININDVLDRTFALKSIWHDDNYFNGRSMDVYIAKLRKYLREDDNLEIVNVHGKGFKLLVKNLL
jgi:DNA-binding response OmpR family regulator